MEAIDYILYGPDGRIGALRLATFTSGRRPQLVESCPPASGQFARCAAPNYVAFNDPSDGLIYFAVAVGAQ